MPQEMCCKCRMRDEPTEKLHSTIDDLLPEAARRQKQWSDLFALGGRRSAPAGLTEADVRREIKAVRKRRTP